MFLNEIDHKALYIFLSSLCCNRLFYLTDVKLTLSSPNVFPRLTSTVEMTCSVDGFQTVGLSRKLYFIMLGWNGKHLYQAEIRQVGSKCSQVRSTPGYYSICGNGTKFDSAYTKSYTLVIQFLHANDVRGAWICITQREYYRSNEIQIKPFSKYRHRFILDFLPGVLFKAEKKKNSKINYIHLFESFVLDCYSSVMFLFLFSCLRQHIFN